MKFEKAVCPYCGAALKVEPDQRSTKCEYCNSVVLISGHRQEDASGFSNQSDSNAGKENTKPGNIGNNGRELPGEAEYSDLYGAQRKNTVRGQNRTERNMETAKRWRGAASLFPPPGFRTKDVPHMILAVIGYLFILGVAGSLGGFKDALFWTIGCLSVVDLCTDWTGFYSRLPGIGDDSRLVRVLTKTFWGFVIFLAWIIIMVLLDTFI